MRKAFAVTVMVAALALTGCTGLQGATPEDLPDDPPAAPTEPYVAPTAAPQPTADAVFNGTINANPDLKGSEVAAKALVLTFCKLADSSTFAGAYESGSSLAVSQGMTAFNFGYVIGAGVPLYCVNQKQAMIDYMKTNGGN